MSDIRSSMSSIPEENWNRINWSDTIKEIKKDCVGDGEQFMIKRMAELTAESKNEEIC